VPPLTRHSYQIFRPELTENSISLLRTSHHFHPKVRPERELRITFVEKVTFRG